MANSSLNEKQRKILTLLAQNKMNVSEVSRRMSYHVNTVMYHIQKIKKETGKDPLNLFDLAELLGWVEVKHGRWKRNELFAPYCTVCEDEPMSALRPEGNYNYCPNCGARMDGES